MSSLPLERPTRYCSRQGSRAFTFSGPRTASASASQRSRQVRNGVSERARATGSRQTRWQDKDCRNQGIRFSARHATFLAHRGSLVSVHASSRSMRGVRQGQAALAHAVKISSGGGRQSFLSLRRRRTLSPRSLQVGSSLLLRMIVARVVRRRPGMTRDRRLVVGPNTCTELIPRATPIGHETCASGAPNC
jgi:hypothetical protein